MSLIMIIIVIILIIIIIIIMIICIPTRFLFSGGVSFSQTPVSFIYGFDYHFNNLRFRKSQAHSNACSAAWSECCFFQVKLWNVGY